MNNRDLSIDNYKGILTVLMICAHIVQFFPMNEITSYFSTYVNLTTFSGFMFSFGYVCFLSYFTSNIDRETLWRKMLKNFIRTIGSFYIVAIGKTIICNDLCSVSSILNIFILNRIPGYSEFLLSFAFMYLFIYLFRDLLKDITTNRCVAIIVISLLCTFIDYSLVSVRILGVIIGSNKFACFPIVQYLSLFIIGGYLAQNKQVFNWIVFTISLIGTSAFIIYYVENDKYPSRFPPSILWIVGSYAFVYGYYILCKKVSSNVFPKLISFMGKNSLSYLVVSNLIIFTFDRFITIKLGKKKLVVLYFIIFVLCQLITAFYVKIKEKLIKDRKNDIRIK